MMKLQKYLGLIVLFFTPYLGIAQKAREITVDNEPADFTNPVNILVLILVPILMIVTGALIQLRVRKRRRDQSATSP